jgi:hypothetical protein
MKIFKRSDLVFKDYAWTTSEGDSAKVTGFPDGVLLNRREGYEVIYFINRFIDNQVSWKGQTESAKVSLGVKIEKMIHDFLPSNIRSHGNVYQWIVSNWNSY